MRAAAVICEYNPFHFGHLKQLEALKGEYDAVIGVMSGDAVQRGEAAIADKYVRARAAVENGLDAVFSLPFPHCCASASDFARAGVYVAASLGADALAIYGPIINVSTFVQCCAYSVGQASQPIISTNFGAGRRERIRETLHLALITSAIFGVFWTALSLLCPNLYIRIFMKPTPEILSAAPAAIRAYALSFLLLPFNIYSTYYFQAIMKPRAAFIVSVARGLIVSGILILALPALAGAQSLWLAMPITELLVMLYAAAAIRKYTRAL